MMEKSMSIENNLVQQRIMALDATLKSLNEVMKEITNQIVSDINVRDKRIAVNFTPTGAVIQYIDDDNTVIATIIIDYRDKAFAIQDTTNETLINKIVNVVKYNLGINTPS